MGGFKLGACCVVVALLWVAGCEDVDSNNIKTRGMYADFRVTGRGDGQSEVRASIRVGGGASNTYAELSPGDVLRAESGDESRTLIHAGGSVLNIHTYRGTFTGAEEGKTFVVSFDRDDDVSAPNSVTALPAEFDITAPAANEEVSRAEPLVITWTPSASGARMRANINGDCIIVNAPTISDDPGTLTIAADGLRSTAGREGETCNVEIRLTRETSGSVDPAFGEGGRFDAVQERTLSFRSTP